VIPTGPPGFRLRFYPGVRPEARQLLKDFAAWLRRRVDFRHPVRVTVVPHATVVGLDGAPGWAVFLIPPDDHGRADVVRIFVAAGSAEVRRRRFGYGWSAALRDLAHDLAHEVVHYEQWRDGRAVDERNVNRRAAALVARYLVERGGAAGAGVAA